MAHGKKQTRQQKKKVKKNQTQQKTVIKEAEAASRPHPPPRTKPTKPRPCPKSGAEQFLFAYCENPRPVFVCPTTNNLLFMYPGFEPFKLYLNHVYVVFPETTEFSALGRRCEIYDGNGVRMNLALDMGPNLQCGLVRQVTGGGCCVWTIDARDSCNSSVIYEIEMCEAHVYQQLTKKGLLLPTKFDLKMPEPLYTCPISGRGFQFRTSGMASSTAKHAHREPAMSTCTIEEIDITEHPVQSSSTTQGSGETTDWDDVE